MIQVVGAKNVSFTRDEDGHRNYVVNWLIHTANSTIGPAYILANWPLVSPGTPYMLSMLERDMWAFCTPQLNIAPHPDVNDGDPIQDWIVTQHFTTKPTWRCNTFPIENPLLEPWDISISYRHEQQEATEHYPATGGTKPIIMHNGERIKGSAVERKFSHMSIEVTKNYATIDVDLITRLLNRVNDAALWGMDERTILFADVRGERLAYGNCGFYWRMTFTFDVNNDTFDPFIAWFGSRVRKDDATWSWPSNEPNDYEVPKNSETYEQLGSFPLDSDGKLATNEADIHAVKYRLYEGDNLLLLGIPTTLDAAFTTP